MRLENLVIGYPYYNNPTMLAIHLAHWQSYPKTLREKCHFVIVDDTSTQPALDIIGTKSRLPITLYRVKEPKIPWNQHGCRNLIAQQVKSKWLFISDMDLVLDAENAQRLFDSELQEDTVYRFSRKKMPNFEDYKHHCNSFLLQREHYWKTGGYDEDYCGTYGGDGPFTKTLESLYKPMIFGDIFLKYYGRTYIHDSGTNDFDRNGPLRDKYHAVGKQKKDDGQKTPVNPVRFEWERLM